MSESDEEPSKDAKVIEAVNNLGADMVDVLDAIHAALIKIDERLLDIKGHLDLATALSLSERLGVNASDIGIEISIPKIKTKSKINGNKEKPIKKLDDEEEKSNGEGKKDDDDDDDDDDDTCDEKGVCHYG